MNDPIADATRSILDGHIILSRQLASIGQYPAIDVLQSVSRVISQVSSPKHLQAARKIREALAIYHKSEDLIQLGAYTSGSNPKLDASIRNREQQLAFVRQDARSKASLDETLAGLDALAAQLP